MFREFLFAGLLVNSSSCMCEMNVVRCEIMPRFGGFSLAHFSIDFSISFFVSRGKF